MHADTDAKGRTGTSLLDSKQRPVRQWDTDRIRLKAPKGASGNIDTWSTMQKDKKSNPYKVFDPERTAVRQHHDDWQRVRAGDRGECDAGGQLSRTAVLDGWTPAVEGLGLQGRNIRSLPAAMQDTRGQITI